MIEAFFMYHFLYPDRFGIRVLFAIEQIKTGTFSILL